MTKNGMILLLLAFTLTLVAPPGFSQDSGGSGSGNNNNGNGSSSSGSASNGSASSSSSNSGSQAVINNNSNAGRQFIQALPGTTGSPGPFPGFPLKGTRFGPYAPAMFNAAGGIPISAIEAATSHGCKMNSTTWAKDTGKESDGLIKIVRYNPYLIVYPADRPLGEIDVLGIYRHPDEKCLFPAIKKLHRETHTTRIAILARTDYDGVTSGFSVGGSGGMAKIVDPSGAGGNDAVAAAAGGLIGKNHVRAEDYPEFKIIALNDGDGPTAPPPTQEISEERPPAPANPTVTVHVDPIKVEVYAPTPFKVTTTSTNPPAATATASAAPTCDLREFVVYFDFAKSNIRPEYLQNIATEAEWLKTHPNCYVVIEGHTDRSGGVVYNDGLGARRSYAVKGQLIADGVPEQQIRYSSFGKHEATREHYQPDRKVVLHVEGASSDPNAPVNPATQSH